jgi:hypothetical protein
MNSQTPKNPPNWPAIHYTIFFSNKQKHINKLKTFLKSFSSPPLFQQNLIHLNADPRIKYYYKPHLIVLNSSIKRDPTKLCQHLKIKIIKHSIDQNFLNEHPQAYYIFFYKNNFFWAHHYLSKTKYILEEFLISIPSKYPPTPLNVSNCQLLSINEYKNNRPTKSL